VDVPDSIGATRSWRIFDQLSAQVKEAIESGTFEARTDNHLRWSLLRLDRQGWDNVARAVDSASAYILAERDRAAARIAASGEKPIPTTVGLAAFESPKDSIKAP
jgi:hypothetical protein